MFRRCLAAITIASALLLLASPFTAAQGLTPPFTVAATPAGAEIFPGEAARFTITVGNEASLLDRSASMNVTSQLPPDWLWEFSPSVVNVTAGARANTTLLVHAPASAAPQTLAVVYEATDSFGFTRGQVNVTVKERPAQQTFEAGGAPAPRIQLAVTPASTAASGERAQGEITITHDDPSRSLLSVQLSVSAPAGWGAFLRDFDQTRNIASGQSATVPVFVDVPTLAQDATVNVTVRAVVGESVFTARWAVTGLAAPDASSEEAPEAGETTDAPARPAAPTQGRPGSGPNFEIRVDPLELDIAPDASQTAIVKLANTGGTTLNITLSAAPPPTWRPIDFEARTLTLAPGDTADVPITLHAPADVPAGGTAEVTVAAASAGTVRNGRLLVHTVEPLTPRDTSAATAAAIEAPAAPEGSGLPSVGAPVMVAVGLAAAGSGALVLLNRPLREKLLWGAAGLYTRLARPDVLGHEDRERLYRLVETQPGIHFHALQRDLAWNTGTLTYHLRVLERHGFVVSRRDGLYRRFYLSGAAPRKETFENQGPTGLRADVMEAIKNSPGISQSDLALGLGANKQTVNYHVKALERAGTIRVEKKGRDTYLFPSEVPSPGHGGSVKA